MQKFLFVFVGVASFVAAFAGMIAGCAATTAGVRSTEAAQAPTIHAAEEPNDLPYLCDEVLRNGGVRDFGDNFVFGAGVGESRDMQSAVDKAQHAAQGALGDVLRRPDAVFADIVWSAVSPMAGGRWEAKLLLKVYFRGDEKAQNFLRTHPR